MRGPSGAEGVDDLVLLGVAVASFSLFFASLAHAYVAVEERGAAERLEIAATEFLEAVLHDPRWTEGRGAFVAEALDGASDGDFAPLAEGRPFVLGIWDVATGERWTFGGGSAGDAYRTADTAGTVRGDGVRPARITATVWGL